MGPLWRSTEDGRRRKSRKGEFLLKFDIDRAKLGLNQAGLALTGESYLHNNKSNLRSSVEFTFEGIMNFMSRVGNGQDEVE